MTKPDTLKTILTLAGHGTISLRNNGDDCVVMFDWPPSAKGRTQVKVKDDSWNRALAKVLQLVSDQDIMEEAFP